MRKIVVIPKAQLEQLYLEQRLSSVKIGKQLNCSNPTVLKLLKNYGIRIRPLPEAQRKLDVDHDTLYKMYWGDSMSASQIAAVYSVDANTILHYLKVFDIPRRTRGEGHQLAITTGHYNPSEVVRIVPKGEKSANWKGGRTESKGYISIKLQPDNFFYPMANSNGYIREHRLVIATQIGRLLHPWEIVHHRGTKYPVGSMQNRGDNRLANLELTIRGDHIREHDKGYKDGYSKGYSNGKAKKIQELEDKIKELEAILGTGSDSNPRPG